MKRGGWHHTEEARAKMRGRRPRVSISMRAYWRSTEPGPYEPDYIRHEEPDIVPELIAVQDRCIKKYGRHTGKGPTTPTVFNSDLSRYGMEICGCCGKLKEVEFDCTECDHGNAVTNR